MSPDTSARRIAENQALFRVVNERIEELHDAFALDLPLSEYVCECADVACCAHILLSTPEYERLRGSSTHFAVTPEAAHVFPEYERVVETYERYWVVEKGGVAAGVAARLDSR
jgi:hypothetical protein